MLYVCYRHRGYDYTTVGRGSALTVCSPDAGHICDLYSGKYRIEAPDILKHAPPPNNRENLVLLGKLKLIRESARTKIGFGYILSSTRCS